jgi:UDP-N-acetylglucosamine:LPS N-acetylglucosamine transferase
MLTDNFLQRLNYRYINPFQECWVPDNEKESNLAGELSHPAKKPFIPIKYLGTLSRLRNSSEQNEKYLLILLSGPEPQRTVLENLLIEQLKEYKALVVLVRGLPGENHELKFASNILVYNHLPAEELAQKMAEAFMIISRCGYSTVMDLVALRKKSILIPTPGQTEQEYLAQHLMKNNIALCIEQKKFRIKNALDVSSHFGYRIEHFSLENNMEPVIDEFIAAVKTSMQ